MNSRPLIVGLGGTIRPGSSSEKALRISLRAAECAGASTVLIAGPQLELPPYAPDCKERTDAAIHLVSTLRACDGVMAWVR